MKYLFLIISIVFNTAYSGNDAWKKIPSPSGGEVLTFQVDQNRVYAGTNNGIYKSEDKGLTWKNVSPELYNKRIQSIATYGDSMVLALSEFQLFSSTNQGKNWSIIKSDTSGQSFQKIAADQHGNFYLGCNPNFYRSTDAGKTWVHMNDSLPGYSGATSIVTDNSGMVFVISSTVFQSYDFGASWKIVQFPLGYTLINRIMIKDRAHIFALSPYNNHFGMYSSADSGATWKKISDSTWTLDYTLYDFIIDSNNVISLATNKGLYYSTNGGSIWTISSLGQYNGFPYSLALVDSTAMLLGMWNEGILRKENYLDQPKVSNKDFDNTYIISVTTDSTGAIYIVQPNAGLSKSTDEGATWIQLKNGLGEYVSFVKTFPKTHQRGNIFATTYDGIYKSTNGGNSWDKINMGFSYYGVTMFEVVAQSVFLVYSTSGFYISFDNGTTWYINNNNRFNRIFSVAYDSLTNMYHAGTNEGAWRTSDPGGLWSQPNNNLAGGDISKIAVSPTGKIFASSYYDIYRSLNNGSKYYNMMTGTSIISDIMIDSKENIFAGIRGKGVYVSQDAGISWQSFNSGLNYLDITALTLDSKNRLIAATRGNGLYRTLEPTMNVSDQSQSIPKSFFLEQNYPNPFNPSTSIKYRIPQKQIVTLCVYDILGREVAALLNEEKAAGEYVVQWNATRFASGLYFAKMTAGSFSSTKKLLLMK